jgi:Asp-tRNA(Asn)/Glu-tRNA(Gln) amidotransferase A subunit family amidase
MRSIMEMVLRDHYHAQGNDLSERINSVRKALPADANEVALHRLRKLANAVLHHSAEDQALAKLEPLQMEREIISYPPPKIGEEVEVEIRGQKIPLYVAMSRNISLGSCASMASLVLPVGITSSGLPVGLEFDALSGNDRQLLSLGLSLEKVLGPIPNPRI